jgi:hypothetical protein
LYSKLTTVITDPSDPDLFRYSELLTVTVACVQMPSAIGYSFGTYNAGIETTAAS